MKYLEQFFKNVNYYQYIQGLKSKKKFELYSLTTFQVLHKSKVINHILSFYGFFQIQSLVKEILACPLREKLWEYINNSRVFSRVFNILALASGKYNIECAYRNDTHTNSL